MSSKFRSNMLTVSFAMRTDSTADPLVQRILSMAMEFNDLTGMLHAMFSRSTRS